MKGLKLIFVFLSLCCTLVCSAQCISAYNRAIRSYQSGKYVEARQTFLWCQSYCANDIDQSQVSNYIYLCEQKIAAVNKALAEKRRKLQEQEEQSRQQVLKNKLIYFSCDAAIFDYVYTRFGGEISMALTKQGYKFTRDKEKALWIITVTAIASKDTNFNNDNYFFATVDAMGTVYNTIEDVEFPFSESVRDGSTQSYDLTAELLFRKQELKELIINDIISITQY